MIILGNNMMVEFKNKLHYFLSCYFCQTFGYDELDDQIAQFKVNSENAFELIRELEHIIQAKAYASACRFMSKYCDMTFDVNKAEKFLNYLYDRLVGNPTKIKATDFIKKCKVLFCPVCTPHPKLAVIASLIEKATVIANNIQIYICKPCKLVWIDENDIRADNAIGYKNFMKANGLKGWWNELKDIDVL